MQKKHAAILISISLMMNQSIIFADYSTTIGSDSSNKVIVENMEEVSSTNDILTEDVNIDNSVEETNSDVLTNDIISDDFVDGIVSDNSFNDSVSDEFFCDSNPDEFSCDSVSDEFSCDSVSDDFACDSDPDHLTDKSIEDESKNMGTSIEETSESLLSSDTTAIESSQTINEDDNATTQEDSTNTEDVSSSSRQKLINIIREEVSKHNDSFESCLYFTDIFGILTVLDEDSSLFHDMSHNNSISEISFYCGLDSILEKPSIDFNHHHHIFLDHSTKNYTEQSPLFEDMASVSTIYLSDPYFLYHISTLLPPNANATICLSMSSSFWNSYTIEQQEDLFWQRNIPQEIQSIIQNSGGRISRIFGYISLPDGEYIEEGFSSTGNKIDLTPGDNASPDSTVFSPLQSDASVTIYSPYTVSPLQDRDLLWLKYSELLSSQNYSPLSAYMYSNGVLATLPDGNYIADPQFLTDREMLVLRLVNESSSGDLTHASLYADLYSVENGTVVLSDSRLLYENIGPTLKQLELFSGSEQDSTMLYLESIGLNNDSSIYSWIIENSKIIELNDTSETKTANDASEPQTVTDASEPQTVTDASEPQTTQCTFHTDQTDKLFSYNLMTQTVEILTSYT